MKGDLHAESFQGVLKLKAKLVSQSSRIRTGGRRRHSTLRSGHFKPEDLVKVVRASHGSAGNTGSLHISKLEQGDKLLRRTEVAQDTRSKPMVQRVKEPSDILLDRALAVIAQFSLHLLESSADRRARESTTVEGLAPCVAPSAN